MEPIDILLVEDNEDDVIIIRESFEAARLMNVLRVLPDGEEAMAYLRGEAKYAGSGLPGLVLLDINMPRKNGFEVLEEMKADPALRHIPVVMMTTSGRDEDVVRSYAGGACTYVRKALTFGKFRDVINQFSLYWTLVATLPPKRV